MDNTAPLSTLSPELAAMAAQLEQAAAHVNPQLVADRRDFHRYAEVGWTEFRTASLIARRCMKAGWEVSLGRAVVLEEARMGLPPESELEAHWQRALKQDGDPEFLPALRGGFTGVVATLRMGEGLTVGLRFDIDALEVEESRSTTHRPAQQGFASQNTGVSHACGHDTHAAIGLGVARVIAGLRRQLRGTVKLIFQPAEEGVRGARAMVAAGVLDDVDVLFGLHINSRWPLGHIHSGNEGYLSTDKFDAVITGQAAHAGSNPHAGHNALLAAATAVLNLYAIARHSAGATRINVGKLTAGTGRNVICPQARLAVETRGETADLNDYMRERALQILEAAAAMQECAVEVIPMGAARSAVSDPGLAQRLLNLGSASEAYTLHTSEGGGGSEDFTEMMRRVQEHGGQAAHVTLGASCDAGGHHTSEFDIDERALPLAVRLLALAVADQLLIG